MPRTRTALLGLALLTLPLAALVGCASSTTSASTTTTTSTAPKAAGGGSSGSSTVARPAQICSLLSPAEASSVMGDSYGGTPYESDGSCSYTGETEKFDLTLSPQNVDWNTATSIDKVQYGTLTTVQGVGDQAIAAPNFLQFRKGSLVFEINDPDGDGTTADKYIALAKVVLSHLG